MERVLKRSILFFAAFFFCACLGTRTFGAPVADSQRKEAALHYYRGIVNFEAGYYENALAEFQQVAAIDPYYKDIQRYIKEALGVLEKQRRELVQGAGEASTYGKSPTDFYFLGKSYYEKGDYETAHTYTRDAHVFGRAFGHLAEELYFPKLGQLFFRYYF